MGEIMNGCLTEILLLSLSPIAFLVFLLMALYSLFRFLCKAALLFIIVAINTPLAVMSNVSGLMYLQALACLTNSGGIDWSGIDPRASVSIEVQVIVSDFIKVVFGELLLVFSTGIITFYTAPRSVFYVSSGIWVVAIFHKWLNTDCLSKTALSILLDGYGLSPLMFFFSFVGFFDIGCHPVAKCAFPAKEAFLFVQDDPNKVIEEGGQNLDHEKNPNNKRETGFIQSDEGQKESDIEQGYKTVNARVLNWNPFKGAGSSPGECVNFDRWNPFERGLFKFNVRIDFQVIERLERKKYILNSFMVLKFLDNVICEYTVERLELPEDYSKVSELYVFLSALALADGFVTDKLRGRYELAFSLLEIADGVENSVGYRTMYPIDRSFVVALCNKRPK